MKFNRIMMSIILGIGLINQSTYSLNNFDVAYTREIEHISDEILHMYWDWEDAGWPNYYQDRPFPEIEAYFKARRDLVNKKCIMHSGRLFTPIEFFDHWFPEPNIVKFLKTII